ncbi:ankyrin repeat protein [Colletotrichum sojae]|uniref:Ankyrin repeat protein n=1 Tax=Colletotrichum sojae TaxID=2175907 RepID=A0A8H6IPL9_9PEZI|nr:ankyrin repeat protein [Colletotrichum sojae]
MSDCCCTTDDDYQQSVDGICDLILGSAFGVALGDIAHPEHALESVRRCLHELSVIEMQAGTTPGTPTTNRHDTAGEGGSGGSSNGSGTFEIQQSTSSTRGSDGEKRRRPLADDDQLLGDGTGDDGTTSVGRQTRKKKTKSQGRLSCPYRKRNPLRFNVRDHQSCALVDHETISSLNHLQVPSELICSPRSAQPGVPSSDTDPEDGITPEVERKLAERKSKKQVLSWDSLWRTLFPIDTIVLPEEFEPVIELDQVKKAFYDDAERCEGLVHDYMGAVSRSKELGNPATGLWQLFQSLIERNLQRLVIKMACMSGFKLKLSMGRVFGRVNAGLDHGNELVMTNTSGITTSLMANPVLATAPSQGGSSSSGAPSLQPISAQKRMRY